MEVNAVNSHGCIWSSRGIRGNANASGSASSQPPLKPFLNGQPPEGLLKKLANGMVTKLDTDQNGSLNLEESGLSQDAFNKIDGDGDGQVTTTELQNGLRDRMEELRNLIAVRMQTRESGNTTSGTTSGTETGTTSGTDSTTESETQSVDKGKRHRAWSAYRLGMKDLMVSLFEVPGTSGTSAATGSTTTSSGPTTGSTTESTESTVSSTEV